MWKSLLRAVGLDRSRSFDAAGGGRRWDGARTVDGLNGSIQAGATTAARRAGWYARNNPWVSAAVQSLAANAVGAGIKPRSRHPDAFLGRATQQNAPTNAPAAPYRNLPGMLEATASNETGAPATQQSE